MEHDDAYEYPFFSHSECPHFPCHEGADPATFNCLFCYCPLYALGPDCGGDFTYASDGIKDCSACVLPHEGDGGTRMVMERFEDIRGLCGRTGDEGLSDAQRTGGRPETSLF